jgi:membrane protein YqaA with SNARE-associated domain
MYSTYPSAVHPFLPMIESAVLWLLKFLAVPTVGLTSVFLIAFVSATLLPLGSEPAVFAVVKANPAMFWPSVIYMAIGKFGRYVFMTVTLLYVPDGWWKWLGEMTSRVFG